MPARSVCLVTLSPSEAGPGRFGSQASVTDIYHAMPCCSLAGTLGCWSRDGGGHFARWSSQLACSRVPATRVHVCN